MFGSRRKRIPDDRPFYKQRSWLGSAAYLALLGVMMLVALVADVLGGESASSAKDGPDPLAGLSGPLSPGDPQHVRGGPEGRPDGCRTEDRSAAKPTSPPADVRWREISMVMVPTSPSAGPLHTDDVWWCFAHTPSGAVLAAHVIPVKLSGDAWRTVAEQQIVPGERRDRFVTRKSAAGAADPESSAVGRFVGFSVTSYAQDSATVRLLLTNPVGGHLSTSVSVRWRDGDWKVALQDDGALYSSVIRTKPAGFVMWGA